MPSDGDNDSNDIEHIFHQNISGVLSKTLLFLDNQSTLQLKMICISITKLLFINTIVCRDIETSLAFIARVKSPDEDDWGN